MAGLDPWASANQGITNYTNTLLGLSQMKRQDMNDQMAMEDRAQRSKLVDLQTAAAQQSVDQNKITLADLRAKQGALVDQYGTKDHTDPLASAVSFQQQEEQGQQAQAAEQKGLEVYFNTLKAIDSMPNLDAATKTGLGKHLLAQNPKYAPFADNLKFVDSKGVKAARMFQDGELKDPVSGQPLPAGYYETEGRWTGDAANPVQLLSYKQAEPPKEVEPYKIGELKEFQNGRTKVYREYAGKGKWNDRADLGTATVDRPQQPTGHSGDGLSGMEPADIKHYAEIYNATGNLPSLGMGASPLRSAILKEASRIARGEGKSGADVAADASDNKALRASIQQQEKQRGAMGSFVRNIEKQVTRFEGMSQKLGSFDPRLLNVPLREVRGRIAGSPNQAIVEMYLTEISAETGKLASGATGSVAELSQGAREKWEKIHDPNLSMADLVTLLKETKHAGQLRMQSVDEELKSTRERLRGPKTPTDSSASQFVADQYKEYRKAGIPEDQIRQRVSSKLRKAGWKDNQITAALRDNSGSSGAIVTKGGFKVTKVD
jgi:hypothetical protein